MENIIKLIERIQIQTRLNEESYREAGFNEIAADLRVTLAELDQVKFMLIQEANKADTDFVEIAEKFAYDRCEQIGDKVEISLHIQSQQIDGELKIAGVAAVKNAYEVAYRVALMVFQYMEDRKEGKV